MPFLKGPHHLSEFETSTMGDWDNGGDAEFSVLYWKIQAHDGTGNQSSDFGGQPALSAIPRLLCTNHWMMILKCVYMKRRHRLPGNWWFLECNNLLLLTFINKCFLQFLFKWYIFYWNRCFTKMLASVTVKFGYYILHIKYSRPH